MKRIAWLFVLLPSHFGIAQDLLQEIVVDPIEATDGWLHDPAISDWALMAQTDRSVLEGGNYLHAVLQRRPGARQRIALRLQTPIEIPGITKSLALWFYTDTDHEIILRAIISDANGIEYKIPFGSCSPDWRLYTLAVPSWIQQSATRPDDAGISFSGIEVLTRQGEPARILIGIDVVTALTDMFIADEDAMRSDW